MRIMLPIQIPIYNCKTIILDNYQLLTISEVRILDVMNEIKGLNSWYYSDLQYLTTGVAFHIFQIPKISNLAELVQGNIWTEKLKTYLQSSENAVYLWRLKKKQLSFKKQMSFKSLYWLDKSQ